MKRSARPNAGAHRGDDKFRAGRMMVSSRRRALERKDWSTKFKGNALVFGCEGKVELETSQCRS